jgi:hypothetical protein
VAWLRPQPVTEPLDQLDEAAQLIAGLGSSYAIEVIDARRAHDIVWRHARDPFDRFVHELDDSPAHAFVAPYAVHFPGVLRLRGLGPQHQRAIAASRTVVVNDEGVAAALAEQYQHAHVVAAPIGLRPAPDGFGAARPVDGREPTRPTFGLLDQRRAGVLAAAADRARDAGAELDIITGTPAEVIRDADVVVVIDWPRAQGPPVGALAAMAAGRPLVVLETLVTASWPALDPQTWKSRGYAAGAQGTATEPPIVVSLDPLDEEHSLMLAITRLSGDAGLRGTLGAAAAAWWRNHATMHHALDAWRRILDGPVPAAPPFAATDHSEHVRSVLSAFGATVDFL